MKKRAIFLLPRRVRSRARAIVPCECPPGHYPVLRGTWRRINDHESEFSLDLRHVCGQRPQPLDPKTWDLPKETA